MLNTFKRRSTKLEVERVESLTLLIENYYLKILWFQLHSNHLPHFMILNVW